MGIFSEFRDFLAEYKVMGLAVAFIMATAANSLVKALVDDIVMPLIGPILATAGTDWRTATVAAGPFKFLVGDFLAALINFLILAFVIFMIAKMIMKEGKVTKK